MTSTETATRRRPTVVRVLARGEELKVTRVIGQLFVCSKANGSCCCGWAEKGRMHFDNSLWHAEWDRRRIRDRVHLSFVGCLGPCVVGNSAMLALYGRTFWLKDLNDAALIPQVYDWVEAMLAVGAPCQPPAGIADHIWDRYLSADDLAVPSDPGTEAVDDIDPVCLMTVSGAEHTLDHEGRRYRFCGPGCLDRFRVEHQGHPVGEAGPAD